MSASADSPDLVAVGRIGPVLGLRGETFVEPWTDEPDERFAAGAVLATEPSSAGPLSVESMRMQGTRLVLRFAGIEDREAAAALRGITLLIPATARPPLDDPDEFYDSDLQGLQARTVDGTDLGPVREVVHIGASVYLVIDVAGVERLVPFVAAIVPRVDVAAGVVEIDPPDGLFEL